MGLTTALSREVAQTLVSATSSQGLNRAAQAALFRVRTRPESPEDNLRELKCDSKPWESQRGEKRKKERGKRERTSP